MSQERRIAAVVVADMVGFSRLMELDEAGTLSRQRTYLAEVVRRAVEARGGRIVKTTGDGLIAVLESVSAAVEAAVEIQRTIEAQEAQVLEERRISYRFGVHLGDVIFEDGDVFGDGVNVAARLEGLAAPGGVVVSGTAHDVLKASVAVGYRSLGEARVKNITRPVRAFAVVDDPAMTGRTLARTPAWRRPAALGAAVAVAIALAASATAWLSAPERLFAPLRAAEMEFPLPDRPSVAVLPFDDFSEEDPQVWFGQGMAEDLITDLSKIEGVFVIARNASFTAAEEGRDLRAIAQRLGVRYVLEGSVRRSEGAVRINAQLIDATTGGHVWADRFDGRMDELFALQDRVTARVLEGVHVIMSPADAASPQDAENVEAHALYLRGLSAMRTRSREGFSMAMQLFDAALALEPSHARANGARVWLANEALQRGWGPEIGMTGGRPDLDLHRMVEAALERPSALAYVAAAELLLSGENPRAALGMVEKGLELEPGNADLHAVGAMVLASLDRSDEAANWIAEAQRLNPPAPPYYLFVGGMVELSAGRMESSLEMLDQSLARSPENWVIQAWRAAVLSELGRMAAAREALAAVDENIPAGWLTPNSAAGYAYTFGRALGPRVTDWMEARFRAAGAPDTEILLGLDPDDRLTPEELEALAVRPRRDYGRFAGGTWEYVFSGDGDVTISFNGEVHAIGQSRVSGDMQVIRLPDRFERPQRCRVYRNPGGSGATLDAHVAVCMHGVFPFATDFEGGQVDDSR